MVLQKKAYKLARERLINLQASMHLFIPLTHSIVIRGARVRKDLTVIKDVAEVLHAGN